jgi:hypothetical protein
MRNYYFVATQFFNNYNYLFEVFTNFKQLSFKYIYVKK